ncbi:MAG TPA: TerC family protein [Candidatus Angelobacter sp.]|nr:TerC family protein [Candidatus Angelobacter sp.]
MHEPLRFWILFNVFILFMLVLELAAFHRRERQSSFKESVLWCLFWMSLAAGFAWLVWHDGGRQKALEFTTGYLIELSLSVDNLFIFLLIFRHFAVPAELQRRSLLWGIVGALVMRGIFVIAGSELMQKFDWIAYLFGVFLVYTAARTAFRREEIDPEHNLALRLFRRVLPVTANYVGGKFVVRREGKLWATPLLLVLFLLEATDVLLATDSIPAVLAITRDAFIVYTSNVFAILGLRSLYFVVAEMMKRFHVLHYGVSLLLAFVGVKMLIARYFAITTVFTLEFVLGVLAISIAASMIFPRKPPLETVAR